MNLTPNEPVDKLAEENEINKEQKNLDYERILNKSLFIEKWMQDMKNAIFHIDPSYKEKEDEVEQLLRKMLKNNMSLPKVILDNNYTGERRESNLLSVLDWTLERKPLVAGNATFYKPQTEAINPIADMIDGFLAERKRLKKEMFKVGEIQGADSDQYKDLDRAQLNEKILANSYYGASGLKVSPFYSLWSGPATTHTAQTVISTTETLFEGLLVDNYKFIDINEAFFFMDMVLEKKEDPEDWIQLVSEEELRNRILSMFLEDTLTEEDATLVERYIHNLLPDERTKIFYIYNLEEFTRRHEKVRDLHDKIFSSVANYEAVSSVDQIPAEVVEKLTAANKFTGTDKDKLREYTKFMNHEYFMDPNSPPDSVMKYLTELNDIYMRYVYMEFMAIDRVYRLKYFPRKTVCVVDTDSNIMALDLWVNFCENELQHGNYGRDRAHNRFIIINTLTYFITSAVSKSLDDYGLHSYIPDEYRPRFNMKNEFYFDKLVIGKKKKRYMSSIRLREGMLMNPPKSDVKGFDFKKATTSAKAKKRFDQLVDDYILHPDLPDVTALIQEVKKFADEIRQSILNGETTYLPLGNAKDLEAYKDPYTQQSVRGAIAWNLIYPANEISFPSKVSIVKLNIFTEEDLTDLKQEYPEIYQNILDGIFHSPNPKLSSKGLQVLAVPSHEKIPEWCMKYIDYNTVINNIIGQFRGVLEIFSIHCPEVGKQIKTVNRKTKTFSNIVRF